MTRNEVMRRAAKFGVTCGGCGQPAAPHRVQGIVTRPQWDGVGPYAMVEFRCGTADCDSPIPLEVDL